jgi:hypothetical protein
MLLATACSGGGGSGGGSSRRPQAAVAAYCPYLPSNTFATPVTVTGSASYEYRTDGNGAVAATTRPIRYAEVQVTNSSGTIVQCAETDGSGAFSFQLPSDNATYTISVLSRASNAYNTAYVMNNPFDNVAYKVATTVTASGTPTASVTALATGNLLGGAFNILDQIYATQEYLRTKTTNCNSSPSTNYFPDCTPFTVAPVVYTFWTAGLTPATYAGTTGAISYYGTPDGYESMRGLYILGGVNGDTENSDMDHFDNSVIVHEFAHFLEYTYGRMDSPGGSHGGNGVIDPRLAWGEGWADFLQGVVLNGFYRDTYGHSGCSGTNAQGLPGCTGATINEDLSLNPGTCGSNCHDKPTEAGEGDFREFSIARLLYQVARSGGTSQFSEIWTVLRGPSYGMAVISDRFKGMGRVHKIQQAIVGGTSWSSLRSTEFQASDLSGYATPFNTSCSSTSRTMAIKMTGGDTDEFTTSDQFRNNDFITYTHTGGPLTLGLTWSGSGNADLDLFVYPQGYVFGADGSRYTYGWSASARTSTSTTSGSEAISATLAAGNYMINVKAYTGIYSSNGTYNTTYNLTLNSSPVCLLP